MILPCFNAISRLATDGKARTLFPLECLMESGPELCDNGNNLITCPQA